MKKVTFTLADLAGLVGAEIRGDQSTEIGGLSTLQGAGSRELAFLANPVYEKYLAETKAGAVILSPASADAYSGNCLVHKNPYLAYAKLTHLWDSAAEHGAQISQDASIDSSAEIGEGVSIGAGVRIAAGARIESGACIGENSVIGRDSVVGKNTRLYPGVILYHGVSVGSDCVFQSGVVLGSDGFGFAPSDDGWQKIAQLGGVVIGDRVEIGANTTIDRGALDNTVIEDGVILDNQIQIAHNVVIGKNTAIAACSAVAGSTNIGANCIIGGASGIAGHLTVVDGVHITAMTMVIKSLLKPGVYSSGTGVQTNADWKKSIARLRRLDSMAERLKKLEKQLNSN
jgi:UDP-3-O-[3-hydroxymyristoyl] glucosamine N-acyltransferase